MSKDKCTLKCRKSILCLSLVALLVLVVLVSSCNPVKPCFSPIPPSQSEEPTPTQGASDTGSIEEYRLIVDGLVDTRLALTYESLMRYPTVTDTVLLVCPGYFEETREWTGVPLATILAEAGIKPEASKVGFYASDGYYVVLPLKDLQREGVFLAYKVDGQTLPKDDGYPVRLVVEGYDGGSWVKFLERIELT